MPSPDSTLALQTIGSLLPHPIIPLALLGSLIPLVLLRSATELPLPLDSTPSDLPCPSILQALSGSFFPPTPPLSLIALAPPFSSRFLSPPQSHEPSALPWTSRPLVSTWLSICSAQPGSPPPLALSPSFVPMVFSTKAPPSIGGSYYHSCGHYFQIRSRCSSEQLTSLWIPTNCTTMIPNDFCTSAKKLLAKLGNVMHEFRDDHLVLSVSGYLRILCSPFVVFPFLQCYLPEFFWSVILLSL